MHTIPRILKIL